MSSDQFIQCSALLELLFATLEADLNNNRPLGISPTTNNEGRNTSRGGRDNLPYFLCLIHSEMRRNLLNLFYRLLAIGNNLLNWTVGKMYENYTK